MTNASVTPGGIEWSRLTARHIETNVTCHSLTPFLACDWFTGPWNSVTSDKWTYCCFSIYVVEWPCGVDGLLLTWWFSFITIILTIITWILFISLWDAVGLADRLYGDQWLDFIGFDITKTCRPQGPTNCNTFDVRAGSLILVDMECMSVVSLPLLSGHSLSGICGNGALRRLLHIIMKDIEPGQCVSSASASFEAINVTCRERSTSKDGWVQRPCEEVHSLVK